MIHPKLIPRVVSSYYRHNEVVNGIGMTYSSQRHHLDGKGCYKLSLKIEEDLVINNGTSSELLIKRGTLSIYSDHKLVFEVELEDYIIKSHKFFLRLYDSVIEIYFNPEELGLEHGIFYP